MSNWIATNELRWIDCKMPDDTWHTHILQQKWQSNVYDTEADDYVYEWRDVPVVEEE